MNNAKGVSVKDIADENGKMTLDLARIIHSIDLAGGEKGMKHLVIQNKKQQLKALKKTKDELDRGESLERLRNEKEYNEKVSELIFGTGERPTLVARMNGDNPKSCYDFVDFNKIEKKDPFEYIDPSKLDYDIKLPDGETKHKTALPYSFLTIKEGEVDKGKEWYMNYDPKLPEGIAELLARYNWGDMKYMTKKSAKNQRKKLAKKNKDILDNSFTIKKGEHILHFD